MLHRDETAIVPIRGRDWALEPVPGTDLRSALAPAGEAEASLAASEHAEAVCSHLASALGREIWMVDPLEGSELLDLLRGRGFDVVRYFELKDGESTEPLIGLLALGGTDGSLRWRPRALGWDAPHIQALASALSVLGDTVISDDEFSELVAAHPRGDLSPFSCVPALAGILSLLESRTGPINRIIVDDPHVEVSAVTSVIETALELPEGSVFALEISTEPLYWANGAFEIIDTSSSGGITGARSLLRICLFRDADNNQRYLLQASRCAGDPSQGVLALERAHERLAGRTIDQQEALELEFSHPDCRIHALSAFTMRAGFERGIKNLLTTGTLGAWAIGLITQGSQIYAQLPHFVTDKFWYVTLSLGLAYAIPQLPFLARETARELGDKVNGAIASGSLEPLKLVSAADCRLFKGACRSRYGRAHAGELIHITKVLGAAVAAYGAPAEETYSSEIRERVDRGFFLELLGHIISENQAAHGLWIKNHPDRSERESPHLQTVQRARGASVYLQALDWAPPRVAERPVEESLRAAEECYPVEIVEEDGTPPLSPYFDEHVYPR